MSEENKEPALCSRCQNLSTEPIVVQFWKHKKNGTVIRATPWWEIPTRGTILSNKEIPDLLGDMIPWKIGPLMQVGWLLENEHGCWFGLNFNVTSEFRKIKEPKVWPPKLKRKKPRGKK